MAKLNKFLGTVEDTEAAFYDAISRADIDGLMAIWAEDDEIICIHPGAPRLIGHAAIRASWVRKCSRWSPCVRQGHERCPHRVVVHRLVRGPELRGGGGWLTGAEVARVDRMGPARDLHAKTVTGRESVPDRPETDRRREGAVGTTLDQVRIEPLECITHVEARSVRVHIAEADEEVGVIE